MNVMMIGEKSELRDKIVKWALEIKLSNIKWIRGIYPGEMAAFLGLCDFCGIKSIVESGRGDFAYSTQILGFYSDKTGIPIVSIDYRLVTGMIFEKDLARYRNLRCLSGNTFNVLPAAMCGLPGPIALLMDGPKLGEANRSSLTACVMYNVQVVAHHNSPLSTPWGKEFQKIFPSAFHYDKINFSGITGWKEFKIWEEKWVSQGIAARPHDDLSLLLSFCGTEERAKKSILMLLNGSIRYNPLWLCLKWTLIKLFLNLTKQRRNL